MTLFFLAIFGTEVNISKCDIWYMKGDLKENAVYIVFIAPLHKQKKQGFFSFIVLVPSINWS